MKEVIDITITNGGLGLLYPATPDQLSIFTLVLK